MPTAEDADLEPDPVDLPVEYDPARRAEQGQTATLVWSAASVLGERDLSLLDLHLRHGLEPHELADELAITPNAAHQAMFRLRDRLGAAVRARLLWRDGEPVCVTLRDELAAAGLDHFTPATARTIARHTDGCGGCQDEQTRVTDPVGLFAAAPFVAAPALLRTDVMHRLAGAGVPVDPAYAQTWAGPDPAGPPGAAGGRASTRVGRTWRRRAGTLVGGLVLVVGVGVLAASELRDGELPADGAVAAEPPPSSSTLSGPPRRGEPPLAAATDGSAAGEAAGQVEGHATPGPTPDPVTSPTADPVPDPVPDAGPSAPEPPVSEPPASEPPASEPTPGAAPRDTPSASPGTPTAPPEDPPPSPAPRIERFVAEEGAACARGSRHTLRWATTEATSVTLAVGGGPPEDVPLEGTVVRCAPTGSDFTLTAVGPGGTVGRTATAPSSPTPG